MIDLELHKYATFARSVGARIQLHELNVRHSIEGNGFSVRSNTNTDIAIKKSHFSRLPAYKDRCKNYNDGESQYHCHDFCLNHLIAQKCFCTMLNNPNTSVPPCDLNNPLVECCTDEVIDEGFDCPLSCEESV